MAKKMPAPTNLIEWARAMTSQVLPWLGSLYFLADLIFELPNTKSVLGVLACIGALIGLVLYFCHRKYDGEMDVLEKDGVTTFSLSLTTDPDDLRHQKEVSFKVIT